MISDIHRHRCIIPSCNLYQIEGSKGYCQQHYNQIQEIVVPRASLTLSNTQTKSNNEPLGGTKRGNRVYSGNGKRFVLVTIDDFINDLDQLFPDLKESSVITLKQQTVKYDQEQDEAEKNSWNDSLNHFLKIRPSFEHLRQKNILKDPNNVIQNQTQLKTLENFLRTRPSFYSLLRKDILFYSPNSVISNHFQQNLENFFSSRPSVDFLQNINILPNQSDEIRKLRIHKLNSMLLRRPSIDHLKALNYIKSNDGSNQNIQEISKKLEKSLENRSSVKTLLNNNILHHLPYVLSPSIIQVSNLVEKDRKYNILKNLFAQRITLPLNDSTKLEEFLFNRRTGRYIDDINNVSLSTRGSSGVFLWSCEQENLMGTLSLQHHLTLIHSLVNEKIVEVSCGFNHILCLSAEGRIYGWGDNSEGQLGLGDTTNRKVPSHIHLLNSPLYQQKGEKVAAGVSVSYVIAGGNVYSYGSNNQALLGVPTFTDSCSVYPLHIPDLDNCSAFSLHCGYSHTFCLTQHGDLYSWGQCGLNHLTSPISKPTLLPLKSCWKDIHCGYQHNIALDITGHVFVWGSGTNGQLGLPQSLISHPSPLLAFSLITISQIAAGYHHSVILSSKGDVYSTLILNEDQYKQSSFIRLQPFQILKRVVATSSRIYAISGSGEIYYWVLSNNSLEKEDKIPRSQKMKDIHLFQYHYFTASHNYLSLIGQLATLIKDSNNIKSN